MGAEWIGPSQGQLDPVREITAEIMAVEEGFSTHEDSTVRLNGGDWNSNMNKLKAEEDKKKRFFGKSEAGSVGKDAHSGMEVPQKGKQGMEGMMRNVVEAVLRELMEEERKIEERR